MNSTESGTPSAPAGRKPEWLKVRLPGGANFERIKALRQSLKLTTVCEEARCPNVGECWSKGTATFMLLGDTCTRACRFCNVKTGNPQGRIDHDEPQHLADAVRTMELSYIVLTMVDRDDLADGGAAHVAACVDAAIAATPKLKVEVLSGDFRANPAALQTVALSGASVLAHNVETTRALTKRVRDGKSTYDNSLAALRLYKQLAPAKLTKSSIMLGLGESADEVRETLRDLRSAQVDIVTLGQYLQPTQWHLPVAEYIHPDVFAAWRIEADSMGFLFCASGPLVRSSYRAGELFAESWLRDREGAK